MTGEDQESRGLSQPSFVQRGGAYWRHGWTRCWLSWPCASLKVYADRLELLGTRYPRQSISLKHRRGLFTMGLEIRNTCSAMPVVFWSLDYATLRSALAANGYEVES